MKRRFWFIPIVLMLALTTACQEPVKVEKIVLEKTEMTLAIGSSASLKADVLPPDAENPDLTWTSSDEGIVSVDLTGKINAVAKGSATITASTANGVKAECNVKVIVPATSVDITDTEVFVDPGESKKVNLKVTPADANDLVWTSSDETIAKVSSDGTVTGIRTGVVTVTASNGSASDTCSAVVRGFTIGSNHIVYDPDGDNHIELTMYIDDSSWRFYDSTVVDDNACMKTGFYNMDYRTYKKTCILELDAIKSGSGKISITYGNYGVEFTYDIAEPKLRSFGVDVDPQCQPWNLDDETFLAFQGHDELNADWFRIIPNPRFAAISASDLEWSSADESIAKIDSKTGKVTGIGELGSHTTITAKHKPTGLTATVPVKIVGYPEKIELIAPVTNALKGDPACTFNVRTVPEISRPRCIMHEHWGDAIWQQASSGPWEMNGTGTSTDYFYCLLDENLVSNKVTFEIISGAVTTKDGKQYYHYERGYDCEKLCIPLEYNGKPIDGLGEGIGFYKTNVSEIVLDPGVQNFEIKYDAFANGGEVHKINLPAGVIIGDNSFQNETRLKCVYVEKGSNISANAFQNCPGIHIYTNYKKSDKPKWAANLPADATVDYESDMAAYNAHKVN